eukprot:scaffold29_cov251-Pinguiococcus_pyrenoidosus.AAC.2
MAAAKVAGSAVGAAYVGCGVASLGLGTQAVRCRARFRCWPFKAKASAASSMKTAPIRVSSLPEARTMESAAMVHASLGDTSASSRDGAAFSAATVPLGQPKREGADVDHLVRPAKVHERAVVTVVLSRKLVRGYGQVVVADDEGGVGEEAHLRLDSMVRIADLDVGLHQIGERGAPVFFRSSEETSNRVPHAAPRLADDLVQRRNAAFHAGNHPLLNHESREVPKP